MSYRPLPHKDDLARSIAQQSEGPSYGRQRQGWGTPERGHSKNSRAHGQEPGSLSDATDAVFPEHISGEKRTAVHKLKPSKLEMPNHSSYHGEISGDEAVSRLRQSGHNTCYLTRYSKNGDCYMLSVVTPSKPFHLILKLNTDENYFTLEGTEKTFQQLGELLKYYETSPMGPQIRSIGHLCPKVKAQPPRIGTMCPEPPRLQQRESDELMMLQQPLQQQQQEQQQTAITLQQLVENQTALTRMIQEQKTDIQRIEQQQKQQPPPQRSCLIL